MSGGHGSSWPRPRAAARRRRRVQALCLALAAALHGGGRRRPVARQDSQARQGAGPGPDSDASDRTDARRATGRDDTLDQPGDGQGHGPGDQYGAEDLARPRPGAAPAAHLQAQPRLASPPARSAIWLGSTSIRRPMRSSSRSTRRARSSPRVTPGGWTAPKPACR